MIEPGLHNTRHNMSWNVDETARCDFLYRFSESHVLTILSNIVCSTMIFLGRNGHGNSKVKVALLYLYALI